MLELRTVEVFRNNNWETCRLAEVSKGEKFRMFEDSVLFEYNGQTEFIAQSDGNQSGIDI